ncbi:MAG: DNA/RNA non-specific endonuclease [Bacteroidetes bacterium]|nr:DNA/RNA non-specific endonuclease [Bacteroidota bacterium]
MARKSSSDSGGFLFKTGIFAVLAGVAFWLFNQFSGKKTDEPANTNTSTEMPAKTEQPAEQASVSKVPENILPASTTGEVVRHTWFTLSYNEDHEQAEWVAYELTRDRLNENWAERPNTFRPDPEVRTESATPRDYTGSGYDKGHLCPAADMAFNETAIDESFFMSNISPQVPAFNVGIWRELEELTRDWARKFNHLYVVTGPIFSVKELGQIGFSKVTVPGAYYKVLYAPDQQKAIAFMLPNSLSERPVMDYACSIDQVEKRAGLDFFPSLLKGLDEELEGSLDEDAWPIDRKRYEERLKTWNRK